MSSERRAGWVRATPDRPPPRTAYHVAALGGGPMGAATAALLHDLAGAAEVAAAVAANVAGAEAPVAAAAQRARWPPA